MNILDSSAIMDNVIEELTISDDLDTEFMRQASFTAHWGFEQARAEDVVRKLEEHEALMFAELYSEHKQANPDSKENESKSYVKKHTRYKQALKSLNRAKLSRDILKVAVRAFDVRRDMLIQLGANRRMEYEGAPVIRNRTARANEAVQRSLGKRVRRKAIAAKADGARAVLRQTRSK